VDVEVSGSERGNVQTGGGDRVSTISLLGCSTSVALATGPTEEEEEEEVALMFTVKTLGGRSMYVRLSLPFCCCTRM